MLWGKGALGVNSLQWGQPHISAALGPPSPLGTGWALAALPSSSNTCRSAGLPKTHKEAGKLKLILHWFIMSTVNASKYTLASSTHLKKMSGKCLTIIKAESPNLHIFKGKRLQVAPSEKSC